MGSKLAVLAAVIVLGGTAAAESPGAAALKKGVDLYKAGKYAEARVQLEKSYKADPNPNTLFALAQAERLAGDCIAAAGHYKQVIAEVSDLNVAKLVQQNLRICEPEDDEKPQPKQEEPVKEDKRKSDDGEATAAPKVVEKTVVVERNKTDKLAAVMLGGGMLALGGAAGLYVAARSNSEAADLARSLPDHDSLADKAKTQRTLMYVSAGAGAVMLGVAVFRFATGGKSEKRDADIAVVPTGSGGSVLLTSHF